MKSFFFNPTMIDLGHTYVYT